MSFYETLRLLFSYLWSPDNQLRVRFFLSVFFNFLSILASITVPIVFSRIIDSFSSLNSLDVKVPWLLGLLAVYVIIWSLSKVFIYLREIIMFPVMERAVRLLAFHLFHHIQLLPFQYHLKRKTGEITSTIETAIQSFPPIVWTLSFFLVPLILESVFVLGIVSFLCGIEYSIILAVCLISYTMITWWGFKKALKPLRKGNFSHLKASTKILDSLLNFSLTKYFHNYQFEFEKIEKILISREIKLTDALIKDQMVRVYQTLVISFSFLFLVVFTGYNFLHNNLSLGEFIMIHTYMLQFALPLEGFGQVFQVLNQNFVKMERALKIFKTPIDLKKGTHFLDKEKPLHIVFEDVWFGYQNADPVLKGISFELFPNETLAIVGETGSGKSTITKLLMGFLEPSNGRILINGYDLKDIDQESLINLIGVVPQEVTLFNDTIAHNILYACLSATPKMLKTAIDLAHLKNTIQTLPQGLETIVGERGSKLSGGEKQRVGLARAIIRQPKLYIFDEATSSLDSKTEKKIIKNIEDISQNASTLIITHKLSTISFADRIISLDKGRIKNSEYESLIKDDNS